MHAQNMLSSAVAAAAGFHDRQQLTHTRTWTVTALLAL